MPPCVTTAPPSTHDLSEVDSKRIMSAVESEPKSKEAFPRLGQKEPLKQKALGAWQVNLMSKEKGEETTGPQSTASACQKDDAHSAVTTESRAAAEGTSTVADIVDDQTKTPCSEDQDTLASVESEQQPMLAQGPQRDVAPTIFQRKKGVVLETMLHDCIRLLGNFAHHYTAGVTRMDATSGRQLKQSKLDYASLLSRCEPVIYGGAAYALLHQALTEVNGPPADFRRTVDIDVRVPFPTPVIKAGWKQFTHGTATRAFEVAQDHVLELVNLLNVSSQCHIQSLSQKGIFLHRQEATSNGFIDPECLHVIARKRPSSRFDHVFPSPGGFGPFFASFTYNESAVFYTFKVCYVWSSNDVQNGEPQYAELIEFQMVPKAAKDCSLTADCQMPGFELRLAEQLDETEWPSLDGSTSGSSISESSSDSSEESVPAPARDVLHQAGFSLEWVPDVMPPTKEGETRVRDLRGRLCIEDTRALAKASGVAMRNRLNRSCIKDGDWEKVLTDERRVRWLQQECQKKEALKKLGAPAMVTDVTISNCEEVQKIPQPEL